MRVEVVFEPECTGEVDDVLVLSSVEHGSYRCSLKGICTPPLPQVYQRKRPNERKSRGTKQPVLAIFDVFRSADNLAMLVPTVPQFI